MSILLRDVFGGDAHVAVVKRVAERADHHVDQRGVVHPSAPTHGRREIRAAAHVLGAARDGHVGIAEHDRLGRGDDRLQATAAQAVERQRRRLDGQPAFNARDPRQVVIVRSV